jgi:hypothetical protein
VSEDQFQGLVVTTLALERWSLGHMHVQENFLAVIIIKPGLVQEQRQRCISGSL